MLTIEESIPSFSDVYLQGQDILFDQFNEVNFYVEDTDLEQLYFQILKKIFPTIRIEKIFPLNGKKNVIDGAKENRNDKKRIYIVDKDFDDLHERIESIDNLFYLDRYCIENYLFEEISILEFVVSENPKIKHQEFNQLYNVDQRVSDILEKLIYINSLFFVVQKFGLPFENSSLHIDCFLQKNKVEICQNKLRSYKEKLQKFIDENDLTIDIENAIESNIEDWKAKGIIENNICGKDILYILLHDLKKEFKIRKLPDHYSACYRLAKECRFESLNFLRQNVLCFLN